MRHDELAPTVGVVDHSGTEAGAAQRDDVAGALGDRGYIVLHDPRDHHLLIWAGARFVEVDLNIPAGAETAQAMRITAGGPEGSSGTVDAEIPMDQITDPDSGTLDLDEIATTCEQLTDLHRAGARDVTLRTGPASPLEADSPSLHDRAGAIYYEAERLGVRTEPADGQRVPPWDPSLSEERERVNAVITRAGNEGARLSASWETHPTQERWEHVHRLVNLTDRATDLETDLAAAQFADLSPKLRATAHQLHNQLSVHHVEPLPTGGSDEAIGIYPEADAEHFYRVVVTAAGPDSDESGWAVFAEGFDPTHGGAVGLVPDRTFDIYSSETGEIVPDEAFSHTIRGIDEVRDYIDSRDAALGIDPFVEDSPQVRRTVQEIRSHLPDHLVTREHTGGDHEAIGVTPESAQPAYRVMVSAADGGPLDAPGWHVGAEHFDTDEHLEVFTSYDDTSVDQVPAQVLRGVEEIQELAQSRFAEQQAVKAQARLQQTPQPGTGPGL